MHHEKRGCHNCGATVATADMEAVRINGRSALVCAACAPRYRTRPIDHLRLLAMLEAHRADNGRACVHG